MKLNEYQAQAFKTSQFLDRPQRQIESAIWNLAEKAGQLGRIHDELVRKEETSGADEKRLDDFRWKTILGDLLWYISAVSSCKGFELEEIAGENLRKINERWGAINAEYKLLDEDFPDSEKLPRSLTFYFHEDKSTKKVTMNVTLDNGELMQLGDKIDDNSFEDDDYRYHDIFHLAYAAVLGWSPVIRRLLKRKRKSNQEVDRVQDGARASAIEEGLVAVVFRMASSQGLLDGDYAKVPFEILKTAERLTQGLEVRCRTYGDWESAILQGIKCFRQCSDAHGGIIQVDLVRRTIEFKSRK